MITLYVKRIKSMVKTVTLQHCSITCSAAEPLNTNQPILSLTLTETDWLWQVGQKWLSSCLEPTTTTHRFFEFLVSQPFLDRLNWNLAWWLSRWYRLSLEQKKYFLAVSSCLYTLLCQLVCLSYISQSFLIGMNWNLAWWLSRWYRPSLYLFFWDSIG